MGRELGICVPMFCISNHGLYASCTKGKWAEECTLIQIQWNIYSKYLHIYPTHSCMFFMKVLDMTGTSVLTYHLMSGGEGHMLCVEVVGVNGTWC
jgi:hypothetical protein